MTSLVRTLFALIVALAAAGMTTSGSAQPAPSSEWSGVARVVSFGDLHGDYAKFVDMARDAGLIDAKGDWSGGQTHLVQLGDVPDRGPDSRKIMDHLMRLEPQARRAGGYVHALIGNHEAMNVDGDLRYVSAGEYAAFADRNSARRRAAYYAQWIAALTAHPPATGLPVFDAAYRAQWDIEHPLGFVEHRLAWSPQGRYGRWVAGHDAVIRINDTLYMHAGLGPLFVSATRDAMNGAVRGAIMGRPDPAFADILTNEQGPLWYRGLALNEEAIEAASLDAQLAHQGVARIVLGHTKRAPLVLPRFEARVILTDIAVPAGTVDPHGYLIQENGALTTVHRGQRIALVAGTHAELCAYLARVAALDPPDGPSARLSVACMAPASATPPSPAPVE